MSDKSFLALYEQFKNAPKCPRCGESLFQRQANAGYCPKCDGIKQDTLIVDRKEIDYQNLLAQAKVRLREYLAEWEGMEVRNCYQPGGSDFTRAITVGSRMFLLAAQVITLQEYLGTESEEWQQQTFMFDI